MAKDIGFFTEVGQIVENLMQQLSTMSLDSKFVALQSLLGGVITINIMYKGYLTMAGKSQDPARELVWDIARKLLILSFVVNVNGWLDSCISALDGFYEWAGGGMSMYVKLDTLTDNFLTTITTYYEKNKAWIFPSLDALLVSAVIAVCYLAIVITIFFSIIAATVTNTFLTIALPLALICFMFQQTKDVFTQWLKMFVSNLFLLLLLLPFLGFFGNHISTIFELERISASDNFWQVLLQTILFSFVLVQVCNVIKDLAKNLAQVTLDSSLSGAGLMSMAGKVPGASFTAAKFAKNAGVGVAKGGMAVGKGAFSIGKGAALGGFKGASKGAAIGSALGPAGTVIGGALGAAGGATVGTAASAAKVGAKAAMNAAKASISKIRNL